jgi:inhibitor of cysteine peptidase
MIRSSAFAFTLALLAACTGTPTPVPTIAPSPMPSTIPTKSSNEIAVTAADNGKTISIAPNQSIALSLTSNSSTGYRWKFIAEPDAKILKLASSDYIPSNTSATPLVGSGGTDVWTFQATGSGTTSLKLGYFPPANPNQAANTFEMTVTVK